MSAPITRSAVALTQADLSKATPRQSFASEKGKQMMGAGNPNTGADKRATASTACPSCGRWHRLGTMCPNTKKAMPTAMGARAMPGMDSPVPPAPEPAPAVSPGPTLLNQPPAPEPTPAPVDRRGDLEEGSQFLRTQDDEYVSALQRWQAAFGNKDQAEALKQEREQQQAHEFPGNAPNG